MELAPNMYVRTKDNGIGKIIEYINNSTHYFFKCYKLDRNCINCEEYITESDVLKASHNIIDLIEVGDYVNGLKVIDIVENDIYISDYYAESYIGMAKVKDIKSIVTKEQFYSMEYRLGDK